MPSNDVKLFNVSVDVSFPKPVAWFGTLHAETADKLAQVAGFPLPSTNFRVRNADVLYNYDISATFFGTNAQFTRSADQLTLNMANGTARDVPFMCDVLGRFWMHFLVGTGLRARVNVGAHIDLGTQENRDDRMARFSPNSAVAHPCAAGYVKTDNGPEPVFVLIEPSFTYAEAVYARWAMTVPQLDAWTPEHWRTITQKVIEGLEFASGVYGIEVALMPSHHE